MMKKKIDKIEKSYKHAGYGYITSVDNSHVIMSNKGIVSTADLYKRGNVLYAGIAKEKFIKLCPSGATSKADWSWLEILCDKDIYSTGISIALE